MRGHNGEGRLHGSLKDYRIQCQQSHHGWNDQRRKEFDKQYTQEIERILEQGRSAVSELSGILDGVIKKCT